MPKMRFAVFVPLAVVAVAQAAAESYEYVPVYGNTDAPEFRMVSAMHNPIE